MEAILFFVVIIIIASIVDKVKAKKRRKCKKCKHVFDYDTDVEWEVLDGEDMVTSGSNPEYRASVRVLIRCVCSECGTEKEYKKKFMLQKGRKVYNLDNLIRNYICGKKSKR